jgi:hypothetical protein
MHLHEEILHTLDQCADDMKFPALDNGYVYLATTRLTLFRSPEDWAMVFEVFGFNPRAGSPALDVTTFASRLHRRDTPDNYVNETAYKNYLATNPHNESRFFYPINGNWQDPGSDEVVSPDAKELVLRGRPLTLPPPAEYARAGIELRDPALIRVFELCRYLAGVARDRVLATVHERRVSIRPEMGQLLQLQDWRHPDVVGGERPGDSTTFRQLAWVLATGDVTHYSPGEESNTHWRNWPDGGSL